MRLNTLTLILTTTLVLLCVPALTAQEKTAPPERLGTVRFPIGCAAAAQPQFDRGVALLHSFWFDAAIGAFTEAAKADPSCGIAHWGVAMAQAQAFLAKK